MYCVHVMRRLEDSQSFRHFMLAMWLVYFVYNTKRVYSCPQLSKTIRQGLDDDSMQFGSICNHFRGYVYLVDMPGQPNLFFIFISQLEIKNADGFSYTTFYCVSGSLL